MEMEGLDERIIRGKVVFSTFHSVKGRQRKHVFVVGFDESYFDYYARDASRTECPNTLYVGCTRATETLVLMEKDNHYEDGPLPFLKRTHAQMRRETWIDFRGKV
jgi:superfamily I DNA/RNA helicase